MHWSHGHPPGFDPIVLVVGVLTLKFVIFGGLWLLVRKCWTHLP